MGAGALAFWSGAAQGAAQGLDKVFERDFEKQVLKFKKEQANLETMLQKESMRRQQDELDFMKRFRAAELLGKNIEFDQQALANIPRLIDGKLNPEWTRIASRIEMNQAAQMKLLEPAFGGTGIKTGSRTATPPTPEVPPEEPPAPTIQDIIHTGRKKFEPGKVMKEEQLKAKMEKAKRSEEDLRRYLEGMVAPKSEKNIEDILDVISASPINVLKNAIPESAFSASVPGESPKVSVLRALMNLQPAHRAVVLRDLLEQYNQPKGTEKRSWGNVLGGGGL